MQKSDGYIRHHRNNDLYTLYFTDSASAVCHRGQLQKKELQLGISCCCDLK